MTSKEIESKLVDLHTTSNQLNYLMLEKYSGLMFPNRQHIVSGRYDFETDATLYTFIDLHKNELMSYLPEIDEKINDGWYFVRTSKTGACLRTKSLDGKVRDYT